jgi:hypothetical protein
VKRIRVTWAEEAEYTQTFEVPDDFEVDWYQDSLAELIVKRAEWTGPNVAVTVYERDVNDWEWVAAP